MPSRNKRAHAPKTGASSNALDVGNRRTHAGLLGAILALSSLDLGIDSRWEPLPGEPRESVFERWSKAGALRRADAIAAVSKICSNEELTLRLRELGVNAKGTKEVLAARVLDSDPAFAPLRVAQTYRSDPGNIVGDDSTFAAARRPNPRSVLQCLADRDIEAAIEAAIEQRANDPSWPVPLTWQAPRYRSETRPLLRRIFTSWPSALDDVREDTRGSYRIAAAMMALHEGPCPLEWIAAKGPTRLRLTDQQIARIVLRAAQHEMRRERWRDAGITHVKVVFAQAPCDACGRLEGRVYNLRGLPPLPLRECSCDGGYSGHLVAYRRSRSLQQGRVL